MTVTRFLLLMAATTLIAQDADWQKWQRFEERIDPLIWVRFGPSDRSSPIRYQFRNDHEYSAVIEVGFQCPLEDATIVSWTEAVTVAGNGGTSAPLSRESCPANRPTFVELKRISKR